MVDGAIQLAQVREAVNDNLCKAREALQEAKKIAATIAIVDLDPQSAEQLKQLRKKLMRCINGYWRAAIILRTCDN